MSTLIADGQAELMVELGIGRQADVGVWDAGLWDQAVWGQADTSLGDWVDVTCSVLDKTLASHSGTNSADGVITRWEASTLAFELIGAQWDPWQGPYAGLLGPALPVRARWRPGPAYTAGTVLGAPRAAGDWYPLFTGSADDDGYHWDPAHEDTPWLGRARVAATDDTSLLAGFDGTEQPEQGQGETASARVTRILDTALWPVGLRDITAGGVSVKATTLAENAWTMLLATADTDLAFLWIRRDGRAAYRPQGRVNPPVAIDYTLTVCEPDAPAEIQVQDLQGGQPGILRNIVSVSRQAKDETDTPATVTVRDDASISRYRARAYARTDLIHTADPWSSTLAGTILMAGAWPSNAPAAASLTSRMGDSRAVALLLALEMDMALIVTDQHTDWRMSPIGWDVAISRREVSGTIGLLDVGKWVAGRWDSAHWDTETWGV